MRILLFSWQFFPNVGGVPQISDTLARSWNEMGHETILITDRDPDGQDDAATYPYQVVRQPDGHRWREFLHWADVLVSNGYSVKHAPRWIIHRMPIVWIHQIYIHASRNNWSTRLGAAARRVFLHAAAKHVYISETMAEHVGHANGVVIPNPIDSAFRPVQGVPMDCDFGFVGRLRREKGVATMLRALAHCRDRGHRYTAKFYGSGDALDEFTGLAEEMDLTDQVSWAGVVRGEQLVHAINAMRIAVVPSDWNEPMGIAAVEQMACGKCVIGSSGGGLGEVLAGYCPTYPNRDHMALAEQMITLAQDAEVRERYERRALERARDYQAGVIAHRYIELMSPLVNA